MNCTKVIILSVICSGLCLSTYSIEGEPDPNDPYCTNIFGIVKGEPITNGVLILSGKYIDAPYMVEQRGFAIFVNGHYLKSAIPRDWAFPMEMPTTHDSSIPEDLNESEHVANAVLHPKVMAYLRHLRQNYDGDTYFEKHLRYLRSLPCVSKIEEVPTDEPPQTGVRRYRVHDRQGNVLLVRVNPNPMLPQQPSKEILLQAIESAKSETERLLRRNWVVFDGPGSIYMYFGLGRGKRLREIVDVLGSEATVAEKVQALKNLDFLSPSHSQQDVLRSGYGCLLTNFQASAQLEERLQKQKVDRPEKEIRLPGQKVITDYDLALAKEQAESEQKSEPKPDTAKVEQVKPPAPQPGPEEPVKPPEPVKPIAAEASEKQPQPKKKPNNLAVGLGIIGVVIVGGLGLWILRKHTK